MLQAKWTEDAVVDLDAPQIGNLGGAQGGLLERAAQESLEELIASVDRSHRPSKAGLLVSAMFTRR